LILVVTTRDHRYTHESLHREPTLDLDVVTYDDILRRRAPRKATHIFTDLDRLSDWELHEAALLYRDLKSRGFTVLNDPRPQS
jgi:class 3 adenylate cyclase